MNFKNCLIYSLMFICILHHHYVVIKAIYLEPLCTLPQLTKELPIVVLVCSYNNAAWVIQNLESIRTQNYSHYRIIYIDDASNDYTSKIVREYVTKHDLQDRCILIENSVRNRKLKNIYTAIHHCIQDDEIIVQLDGDDRLAHDNVLARINQIYQEHDIWITYGNFQNDPAYPYWGLEKYTIPLHDLNIDPRQSECNFMHLRTFYGWLAKLIKIEDLLSAHLIDYKSQFYPASNDAALMWPMLEMAGSHAAFINEILYWLNRANPLSGFRVDRHIQRKSISELRIGSVYHALSHPISLESKEESSYATCCFIFSQDNAEGARKVINSIMTHVSGLNHIYVLYAARTKELEASYQLLLKEHSKQLTLITTLSTSIPQLMHEYINASNATHILLSLDSLCFTSDVSLSLCIQELTRTGAYGLYFGINDHHALPHQLIWHGLSASKFHASTHAWFNSLDMTLLRIEDFQKKITCLPQRLSLPQFIAHWYKDLSIGLNRAGIYFDTAKTSGTPTLISTKLPPLPLRAQRAKS